jgi:hypothetical protein
MTPTEKTKASSIVAATTTPPTTVVKAATAKRAAPVRKATPVAAKPATVKAVKAVKVPTVKPTAKPVAKPKQAVKASKSIAAPATTKAIPSKAAKAKKPKMVRDSFTIPKPEYDVLAALKLRAVKLGSPAKKTELVRAGIKLLAGLSDAAYRQALSAVPSLKTGRPAKAKKA